MSNIYIIYRAMFNLDGTLTTIGGIENYILNLTEVLSLQGWKCHLVQPAKEPFMFETLHVNVHGVSTGFFRGNLKKFALAKWVQINADKKKDIIIYATDSYAVNLSGYKQIAIQHGISWDKPRKTNNSFIQFTSSLLNHCKYLSYIKNNSTLVCVDHNFINWYRTWFNVGNKKVKIIYNFYNEKISNSDFEKKWNNNSEIKIIIARRFVDYRGIELIAPIIKRLLPQHNIQVSFAGDGPLKPYLESLFANDSNVDIMQYGPDDSFKVHKEHHIAIIPTLGSEGTSLSMIEAMAAGCMVLSSNIGGLSNLIIDGYNGSLVMPTSQDMEQALSSALNNVDLCKNLAKNGLNSITLPCAKDTWSKDWIDVINNQ